MNRTLLAIALVLLGGALVANPLYLYPEGGGDFKKTYHVERIENESVASQALGLSDQVLSCPGERPCALETRVLESGGVEYDGYLPPGDDYSHALDRKNPRWYPVVRIGGETYLPEAESADETIELRLVEADDTEAVERAAVPADERSPEVREAVETGSVTVYGERVDAFERGEIIEHDGEYFYRAGYVVVAGHWTGGPLLAGLRAVLFVVGCGLLVRSGWWWHDRAV